MTLPNCPPAADSLIWDLLQRGGDAYEPWRVELEQAAMELTVSVASSAASEATQWRRVHRLIDHYARRVLPLVMDAHGAHDQANALRELAPLTEGSLVAALAPLAQFIDVEQVLDPNRTLSNDLALALDRAIDRSVCGDRLAVDLALGRTLALVGALARALNLSLPSLTALLRELLAIVDEPIV